MKGTDEIQGEIEKGIGEAFHAHLDECQQCHDHPMDLCKTGAELLGLILPASSPDQSQ